MKRFAAAVLTIILLSTIVSAFADGWETIRIPVYKGRICSRNIDEHGTQFGSFSPKMIKKTKKNSALTDARRYEGEVLLEKWLEVEAFVIHLTGADANGQDGIDKTIYSSKSGYGCLETFCESGREKAVVDTVYHLKNGMTFAKGHCGDVCGIDKFYSCSAAAVFAAGRAEEEGRIAAQQAAEELAAQTAAMQASAAASGSTTEDGAIIVTSTY